MDTIKCPNCGSENLSTNIRCEKCNEQLITEDQEEDMDLDLERELDAQQDPVQEAKDEALEKIYSGIHTTIVGVVFTVFMAMLEIFGADSFSRIVGLPFFICGIAILIKGISEIVMGKNTKKNVDDYVIGELDMEEVEKSEEKYEKVSNFTNKIYYFGFLLFWFGFLIVFDALAIKAWSEGGSLMFFFSLIFWAVGIYILIRVIKKRN